MQAVPDTTPVFVSALSASPETSRAADMVCDVAEAGLGGKPDLVIAFYTGHHVEMAGLIGTTIRRRLSPGALLGVSGVAVIGNATELEGSPGLTLLAARLPGVTVTPFTGDALPTGDDDGEKLAAAMGTGPDLRAAFLFADPFSTPLVRLLPAMNAARGGGRAPIIGGMASAASAPGGNALLFNDRVMRTGAVGVSLSGRLRADSLVSQGCRPFGPTMVVTKARRNIVFELGGKPALEVVSEAVGALTDQEREGLKGGLFVGRVINEYKDHFGRDDFLIRSVMGVDHNHGALAVAELMNVGQTIRLHMRDAVTAHEDLALLLDAQGLYDPPAGVLLVTCNGRGRRLFDAPSHDARLFARAFAPAAPGEARAKAGRAIETEGPSVPLAGFFAAGEIGPIDGQSFVHGHTAIAAIFRAGEP